MISPETLLVLSHPVVVAIMGGAIVLTRYYDPARPRYLLYIGLAYLAYSAGVALQKSGLPPSSVAFVLISGLLYLTSIVLVTHGIVSLSGSRYPLWFPLLMVAGMLAARTYYFYIEPNAFARFLALHTAVTLAMLHGAWRARSLLTKRAPKKVMYGAFLFLALSIVPRIWLALGNPSPGHVLNMELYWALTQASIYVFSLVFGIALILTIMQRRVTEHRIRSETDPLTGLRNRRGFLDLASRQLHRTRHYALIIGDIDHFKKVNDTYGHRVGDIVLTQAAKIIDDSIRSGDISGRIGGEEFAVFLPDTSLDDAYHIAERLRHNIEHFVFQTGSQDVRCTISLGVREYDSATPLSEALWQADAQLYHAKHDGRNRVTPAEAHMDTAVARVTSHVVSEPGV